jgi:oxygen-independent coproporphyrinogen-3 oxidase
MVANFVTKYGRSVPRYTSYPTAPNFRDEVGGDAYRRWLGELARPGSGSLYIHVPFCRALCWYCGCHTWVVSRERQVSGYEALLRKELELVAAALPVQLDFTHVHWGGGTPTTLGADSIRTLSDAIRTRFEVAPAAEIAIEIDPRVLNDELVAALVDAGITRASVGVQDFDFAVQQAVNRVQPYDLTAAAIERLRHAGIDQINLDLMYGLPLQTVDSVVASVDQAITLAPQRLALFGYAHVPWMKAQQRLLDARQLPDGPARWAQFAAAASRLREHGYIWIGLDHFAKPDDPLTLAMRRGTMRRNFQGYTTDTADVLIGVGPSAISSLPQGYMQNIPDLTKWSQAVGNGRLATCRGVALTHEDRMRRHVIERLMCDLAVNLREAAALFEESGSAFDEERLALSDLALDGVINMDGDRIVLTEEGRPLMRVVSSVFDRYLTSTENRHASAV